MFRVRVQLQPWIVENCPAGPLLQAFLENTRIGLQQLSPRHCSAHPWRQDRHQRELIHTSPRARLGKESTHYPLMLGICRVFSCRSHCLGIKSLTVAPRPQCRLIGGFQARRDFLPPRTIKRAIEHVKLRNRGSDQGWTLPLLEQPGRIKRIARLRLLPSVLHFALRSDRELSEHCPGGTCLQRAGASAAHAATRWREVLMFLRLHRRGWCL